MTKSHAESNRSAPESSPYSKAFFVILAVKILASCTLGSHFIRDLTSPFVQWTLANIGSDPWSAFVDLGSSKAFPYHIGMLASLIPGRLVALLLPDPGWQVTTWVDLASLRMPLLAADLLIYIGLIRLTHMPVRKAVWIYWASPIVFYVNYIHGQLDILPVAWVFASFWLVKRSRLNWAAVAFGAGMGTKSTALLLLPIMLTYVLRNHGWTKALRFAGISLGLTALAVLPLLGSPGYRTMVLGAEEQFWLFKYSLNLPVVGATIYLSVLALILCYMKIISIPRMNMDLAFAFWGLCIIVVLVLVPPMPGWFMWLVPPLAYLAGLGRGGQWKTLVALNASYLVWFLLFARTADLFDVLQTVTGGTAPTGAPVTLPATGLASQIPGVSVTVLMGSLLYCAYDLWKHGVASNEVYRRSSAVVVGISGDSGAGKDTLCRLVAKVLGPHRMLQLDGDDYHRWARSDPRYNRFSHLHPASNRLHQHASDLNRLAQGEAIDSPQYDHASGQHTPPVKREPKDFILASGLHTFLLGEASNQFDVRIYLDPEPALREHWKMLRDTAERGHTPDEVQQQIEKREPDASRFVRPQQGWADLTVRLRLREGRSLDDYRQIGELATELVLTSTGRFDWNTPIGLLAQAAGDLKLDVDLSNQGAQSVITVFGKVSAQALAEVALELIPNLHEIAGDRPRWEPGLNGVLQLFVVHFMAQARRFPDEPFGVPHRWNQP